MSHFNHGGSRGGKFRKFNDHPPPFARPEFSAERREKTLWVGNLDKKVTEYHLIKLFSKFGEIVREQFMWWQHGEMRGAPRGYAFVEMKTREEALAAQRGADETPILGRNIRVRFSEERDTREFEDKDEEGEEGTEPKTADKAEVKPKFSRGGKISTQDKIRAIEEKLRRMQQGKSAQSSSARAKQPDDIKGYGKAVKQEPLTEEEPISEDKA
eukprot:CAMPEP_0175159450 /NCGR_PEP_ID=MMETSP0087-20121206/23421_1 /TAXON_ID=136419 /ORGANISM="Unknown Unknown, Strain D1" /LENGTH=212 /DNA_ID=CAMNT_0016447485 /DNA_START=61 /DNA_END=697 /DNA_ORIENTATION=-